MPPPLIGLPSLGGGSFREDQYPVRALAVIILLTFWQRLEWVAICRRRKCDSCSFVIDVAA